VLSELAANGRGSRCPVVLIVDQAPGFHAPLTAILRGAGDEVTVVATGEEGLRQAAAARPDVLVAGAPGSDGAALIRRVKLDPALRRTRCVLLTSPGDEAEVLEVGADALVRRGEDPAVIAARVAALLRAAAPAPVAVDSAFGPKKVLAVDDSEPFLALLSAEIRGDGYEVVLATSGEAALALLELQPFDCILLDLMMPGLSGPETCRRIRGTPAWKDIPLIFLSSRDDPQTMIEAFNLGADDYILKSSSFEEVKARLRAQIRRRHADDEDRRIREELLVRELEASEARAARELAQTRAALERARQELEADALLRAVAEGTTDAVYVKDREGRYLMINTAGARLLGKSVAEVIGHDDRAFFPLEEAEAIRDADRTLMDGGNTRTTEEQRLVAGVMMSFLTTKGPHRDDSGRVVGLIGIARDVSARKRAEENQRFLAEATIRLAESLDSETSLSVVARLVATRICDICLIHLLEGDALHRVAAAHADSTLEPSLLDHLARPEHEIALRERLRAMVAEPAEEIRSWRGSTGSGNEVPAVFAELGARSHVCVPMVARGRALGVLSLLSRDPGLDTGDLTMATELARRAALAVDNTRLYRQATDAIHARDDFLAIASHELRTPLAALVLQVQSLQSVLHAKGLEPEVTVLADRAARHIGRLGNLIERLLDVSRITTGRIDLDPEEMDLSEVVREVTRRLRESAKVAGSLITVAADHPTIGLWDRLRMDQIVTNLLSNALKYGAGKPVEVTLESDGVRARLIVRDWGIGIASDDVRRIFGRFERAAPARNFSGMGLGLYITRQAVEAHGGRIAVQSEPGNGATFTVELPLRARELVERPKSKNILLSS
jgi:PAS domain S-box-containing protein